MKEGERKDKQEKKEKLNGKGKEKVLKVRKNERGKRKI